MKTKPYIYRIYILIAIPFLLHSCVNDNISLKNLGTVGINGALVMPIVSSTLTFKEFLDNIKASNLSTDSTGMMYLHYTPTTTYNLTLNNSIQDIAENESVDFGGYTGTANAEIINTLFSANQSVSFDVNDFSTNILQLDSMRVNSMQLEVTINSNINFLNNRASITITPDPNAFSGILPVSQTVIINNLKQTPCTFVFNNVNIKPVNGKIPIKILLQEIPIAQDVSIPDQSTFTYNLKLKNIDFSTIHGQFSLNTNSQKDTVDLNFIYNAIQSSSTLPFTNPQLALKVSTNARLPLNFTVNSISSYNSSQPNNKSMATFDNGSFSKSFPLYNMPSTINSFGTNTLIFNNKIGHIDKLFSQSGINKMIFDCSGSTRTDTVVKNQFVMKNNIVQVTPSVIIPLSFNPGVNINIKDTVAVSQSVRDFLNKDSIEQTAFWLTATNYTSVQIGLTATLLNDRHQTIGSSQTFTLNVTETIDASGRPSGTSTSQPFYPNFKYTDIQQACYVVLTYTLKGKDTNTPVSVYANDFITVKLSAYAKGSVTFN
jgi:hypothetical protein